MSQVDIPNAAEVRFAILDSSPVAECIGAQDRFCFSYAGYLVCAFGIFWKFLFCGEEYVLYYSLCAGEVASQGQEQLSGKRVAWQQ